MAYYIDKLVEQLNNECFDSNHENFNKWTSNDFDIEDGKLVSNVKHVCCNTGWRSSMDKICDNCEKLIDKYSHKTGKALIYIRLDNLEEQINTMDQKLDQILKALVK